MFVRPARSRIMLDAKKQKQKETTNDIVRINDEPRKTERRWCMKAVQKMVPGAILIGRRQARRRAPERGA